MKVSINVSKNIPVPRVSLNGLWLAIAAVLRLFTTAENDRAVRELAGELTPAELAREAAEDRAHEERTRLADEFWSSG